MDVLIAIAQLCAVSGTNLHHVDAHQKACQKQLIECYEKNHPKDAAWYGPLKDCVLKMLEKPTLTPEQ